MTQTKSSSAAESPWGNMGMAVVACLTLGLAPFVPEPHIWGKIKWVAGGAVGMKPMDWFDLAMHGAPWVYLVFALAMVFLNKPKTAPS